MLICLSALFVCLCVVCRLGQYQYCVCFYVDAFNTLINHLTTKQFETINENGIAKKKKYKLK